MACMLLLQPALELYSITWKYIYPSVLNVFLLVSVCSLTLHFVRDPCDSLPKKSNAQSPCREEDIYSFDRS